ncbi:MAG TPA: type II toxin-antitoxin system RelE/ParE family toxin [Acetobacteraceae bacterium]
MKPKGAWSAPISAVVLSSSGLPGPAVASQAVFVPYILFRANERAIYVYGFAKNERDNIGDKELAEFRKLSAIMLAYGEDELLRAIETGALIEVV